MILDKPLTEIGGKGLFTKELDVQLLVRKTTKRTKILSLLARYTFPFLPKSEEQTYTIVFRAVTLN